MTEADADHILVERAGPVLTLTLNRPERKNAVSRAMWGQLRTHLRSAADDSGVRVVVITGAGGAFCSGADLSGPAQKEVHPLSAMDAVHLSVLELHRLPKITIARVDGDAVGAGMNIALACDFVVASERSRFAEIFVLRGLSVDCGGSWLLPRLIGLHRAKQLCLTGELIDAAEAAAMGLLTQVVPVESLDAEIATLVERVVRGAPIAQLLTKKLLNAGGTVSLEQALGDEAAAQVVNLAGGDAVEARDAFTQRRPAVYTGEWALARNGVTPTGAPRPPQEAPAR